MMLQQFKARYAGAKKGHEMLKKIVVAKKGVATGIKDCSFAMAKSSWASGNISSTVIERVKKPSSMLKAAAENVAGVSLPKFVLSRDESKDSTFENFGVGAGGQVVQTTRQQHIDTLTLLIKM